ncbi:transcriptional repressor LexA [Patescibacteria group bacterium]|nr:repressor LexA [Candidatus Falkowbacteria bacterium]MBU3906600.1 transcriptional repressor LexA [Patescibacteria group bacterium]MCG2698171.1 transcriptional repressor LexA [Candidatus Parcubacteria bacterium]MBU4014588.1 transcriptional repressor LexA [Patescibacteria group bacterium]MBU4027012.1 transcriptional repressor LexA [Patescibacteria group bacterium]
MIKSITPKQKKVLEIIYNNIELTGFPPTLADLKNELNVSSNQAVLNYLETLEKKGYIERVEGQARGIKIMPLGYKILNKDQLVPVVGESAAGPFFETLEATQFNWTTLPGEVLNNKKIKQSEEVFIIKVRGDSMINAGINDEDMLLVKKTREFKSGDIVVARSDDGTTVKRFVAEPDGRAYLKPENPAYKNIPIFEETIFEGKVIINLSQINPAPK